MFTLCGNSGMYGQVYAADMGSVFDNGGFGGAPIFGVPSRPPTLLNPARMGPIDLFEAANSLHGMTSAGGRAVTAVGLVRSPAGTYRAVVGYVNRAPPGVMRPIIDRTPGWSWVTGEPATHAEINVLNSLGAGDELVAIAASSQVCARTCQPALLARFPNVIIVNPQ